MRNIHVRLTMDENDFILWGCPPVSLRSLEYHRMIEKYLEIINKQNLMKFITLTRFFIITIYDITFYMEEQNIGPFVMNLLSLSLFIGQVLVQFCQFSKRYETFFLKE